MWIFDFVKTQLRSVIQWENPDPNTLYHSWTQDGNEIKNASKLIVNPGQGVIFVYQGKVSAVHTEPGTYDLTTDNIPFWTTISRFMQKFESEFKVGIYFVRLTDLVDQKWGTKAPVKYLDPIYKFPVGLRAFGNFSFRITEPESFFVNVVGTQNDVLVSDVARMIADRVLQPLTDVLAEANFGYTEVDKQRNELSAKVKENVADTFVKLGFSLTDFRIENTDFDDETQKRIWDISDVIAQGQAASAVGLDYSELQKLHALRDAAKNEWGAAGAGIGIGAGLGLGQMMAGNMMQNQSQAPATQTVDHMGKLAQLKQMLDGGLITQGEYDAKKVEILNKM